MVLPSPSKKTYQINDPVSILGRLGPKGQENNNNRLEGIIAYLGPVQFGDRGDDWVGVHLTGSSVGKGKNDGSVQGVRYFSCINDKAGVFVRKQKVVRRVLTKIESLRLRRDIALIAKASVALASSSPVLGAVSSPQGQDNIKKKVISRRKSSPSPPSSSAPTTPNRKNSRIKRFHRSSSSPPARRKAAAVKQKEKISQQQPVLDDDDSPDENAAPLPPSTLPEERNGKETNGSINKSQLPQIINNDTNGENNVLSSSSLFSEEKMLFESIQKLMTKLQLKLETREKKQIELESQMNKLKLQNTNDKEEIESLRITIHKHETDKEERKTKEEELQSKLKSKEEEANELQNQLEQQKTMNNANNSNHRSMIQKKMEDDVRIAELQNQVHELNASFKAKDEEISYLKNSLLKAESNAEEDKYKLQTLVLEKKEEELVFLKKDELLQDNSNNNDTTHTATTTASQEEGIESIDDDDDDDSSTTGSSTIAAAAAISLDDDDGKISTRNMINPFHNIDDDDDDVKRKNSSCALEKSSASRVNPYKKNNSPSTKNMNISNTIINIIETSSTPDTIIMKEEEKYEEANTTTTTNDDTDYNHGNDNFHSQSMDGTAAATTTTAYSMVSSTPVLSNDAMPLVDEAVEWSSSSVSSYDENDNSSLSLSSSFEVMKALHPLPSKITTEAATDVAAPAPALPEVIVQTSPTIAAEESKNTYSTAQKQMETSLSEEDEKKALMGKEENISSQKVQNEEIIPPDIPLEVAPVDESIKMAAESPVKKSIAVETPIDDGAATATVEAPLLVEEESTELTTATKPPREQDRSLMEESRMPKPPVVVGE